MPIRNFLGQPITGPELKRLLGLPPKLPREHRDWEIQGYYVKLMPLEGEAPVRKGAARRRMKHRLLVECKFCLCMVSAGRLRQHERACKQKDNYSV